MHQKEREKGEIEAFPTSMIFISQAHTPKGHAVQRSLPLLCVVIHVCVAHARPRERGNAPEGKGDTGTEREREKTLALHAFD